MRITLVKKKQRIISKQFNNNNMIFLFLHTELFKKYLETKPCLVVTFLFINFTLKIISSLKLL
jgi:hypothetical protein